MRSGFRAVRVRGRRKWVASVSASDLKQGWAVAQCF